MKTFVALLAAVALIPAAAFAGYALNTDPPAPTLDATLERTMVPSGPPQVDYMYVVTKGPLKGQTAPPSFVVTQSKAQLEAQGARAGEYVRMACQFYTDDGSEYAALAKLATSYCERTIVTQKAALDGEMRGALDGPVG